jgi:CheY-like chemotaxis protein
VRPAIGIVGRFETDANYYQIAQDGQMLFSLAQAINRIRAGWTPPIPIAAPSVDTEQAEVPVAPVAVVAHREISPPETRPAVAAPAIAAATTERSPAAAVSVSAGLPWQRALNILVIDDSHFSREAISVALVKVGFAVNTAEDGKEGIRMATEKLFDVALVDFEMPGMQGPEVLRKLRALGAKAPTLLIMLTSRTGAVDRLRAKFAGCDAYMTKPTRMQEFLKILRDFAIAGKLTRS